MSLGARIQASGAWLQGLRWNGRLAIGLLMIALSAFAFYRNIWSTVATEANINAALLLPLSPIPGRVESALPLEGTRIVGGMTLKVDNERVNLTPQVDLQAKLSQAESEIKGLDLQIGSIEKAIAEFRRSASAFATSKGEYLDQRVRDLQAQVDAQRAVEVERRDRLTRLQQLPTGSVPVQDVVGAQAQLTAAENEVISAQAALDSYVIARRALRGGVQISDGLPDRTYSDQRVQELGLQLATARAKRAEQIHLKDSLAESMREQSELTSRLRSAEVPVPDGVVWRRLPENSYVVEGGELGAIAVCGNAVVTATLTRRDFKRLFVGMAARATVRHPDTGAIKLDGEVIALTGPTLENSQHMAIPFGRGASDDGYGAVVRVRDTHRLQCRVGAAAQLEFFDRPADAGRERREHR